MVKYGLEAKLDTKQTAIYGLQHLILFLANTAIMPVMIVIMLVSVTGMLGGGAQNSTPMYFIPLYSSVQSMSGVFSLDYSIINIVVSCLSNLIYACIGGIVLARMFNSESIMFSR